MEFFSVSPCNVEILADLAILYLKVNEVDRAYEKLQEALAVQTSHTNCLLAMGAIHQTRNDIDLALNAYKNVPKIQDEGFEIWSNVGLCFYRKNKLIAVIMGRHARGENFNKFILHTFPSLNDFLN